VDEALDVSKTRFQAIHADRDKTDFNLAGAPASGNAVAGVLFRMLGTAADGATGVWRAVPLVRRAMGGWVAEPVGRFLSSLPQSLFHRSILHGARIGVLAATGTLRILPSQ
jgi:hypothetical protein